VRWVSADTTEAEEREGMKKTEGREEGKDEMLHDVTE
jgi:hypothetical protein